MVVTAHRLKRIFFALALALGISFLAAPAHAELDAAQRAYESGDYATAWRELLPIQTDPRAAFVLALMSERGQGTPINLSAAAEFYKIAARAGHPVAMIRLGAFYDHGDGVPRNGDFAQNLYGAVASGTIRDAENPMVATELVATGKNNLAYLWARQNGLLPQALCLSAETIAAQPHNAAFIDTYGFILMRMGKLDDAQKFLEKSLQEATVSGNLEHMGDLASLRGDKVGALGWWERASKAAVHPRDAARLQRKIAGGPDEFDSHPPFDLTNHGLGENCTPTT